jgi:predicted RNA-binding protein associated with RNAse of E/G family
MTAGICEMHDIVRLPQDLYIDISNYTMEKLGRLDLCMGRSGGGGGVWEALG